MYNYCRTELLEKYQAMDCALDIYFAKPRLWHLSIYDHAGAAAHFYYRLNKTNIHLVSEGSGEDSELISWATEVPISKFYAALESGESLTSMYMRINDRIFAPVIEKEIQAVDVVDDPLIRCLFNTSFGAYQREQLKRLHERKTSHA